MADRVYASALGESAARIRRGRLDDVSRVSARLSAARGSCGDWASRIGVDDQRLGPKQAITELKRRWTPQHRLVVFDYAQVFGDTGNDESITQKISDFVWDANEFAKAHNAAVVILSQVRKEVKARGRQLFDQWRYRNQDREPTTEAVEGYRPLSGDGYYAPGALGQKARAVLSWFRPGLWLREHGADVRDDSAECMIVKNNYGESKMTIRLHWHGPTTRITDRK